LHNDGKFRDNAETIRDTINKYNGVEMKKTQQTNKCSS